MELVIEVKQEKRRGKGKEESDRGIGDAFDEL